MSSIKCSPGLDLILLLKSHNEISSIPDQTKTLLPHIVSDNSSIKMLTHMRFTNMLSHIANDMSGIKCSPGLDSSIALKLHRDF